MKKRTGLSRRAFLGSAAAAGAAALSRVATLVRPPYVQNVRRDRGTILWTTLENGQGTVQYSADRSFSRSAPARVREFPASQTGLAFTYYQYQADLPGLSPGSEYFYRVIVDGQDLTGGADLRFRTAASGPFTFLVFGDSGQGTLEQFRLAGWITQEGPALVIHAGDIAYFRGTFQEFDSNYFGFYLSLMQRVPFFPCPGNHEYGEDRPNNAGPYLALHSVPAEDVPAAERGRYYSFDWANVHFVSLDSNASLVKAASGTGRMLEWLDQDLANSRQFWRIVFFHHAPYASGLNDSDPLSALVRQHIVPILERHGVELVLNGHEHSYQRGCAVRGGACAQRGGTVYVTTGGGGASLYPVLRHPLVVTGRSAHHYLRGEVQGSRLTLRAIGSDGREFDSVTLAPTPIISTDSTVNAASFTTAIAPGALISIFGQYLASEEAFAAHLPLPIELAGTSVTLNGQALPLLYASRNQINAQLLFEGPGRASLRVNTPNGSVEATILILEAAPAIFSVPTDRGRLAAVLHADGTLVSPSAPAETAEGLAVFLTGLGQVNGEIRAGQPAPFSPPLTARAPVEIQLGAASATPFFAGLAPGFAGLYQVNFAVPTELPTGTHALRISAKGIVSNTVQVAVRSTAPGEAPQ